MFIFLYKTVTRHSTLNLFYPFRIPFPKSYSQVSESANHPPSLTVVDYLINSCGLSPEAALSASKRIRVSFKSTKNPDSVLRFLGTNGFCKTHIAKIISLKPLILFSKVDKTLKPKIKQLQDLGLSSLKLTELIASAPSILTRSVENVTVPSVKFIKSFVGTEENVVRVVKRARWFRSGSIESLMAPNITLLKDYYNVPDSGVAYLMMNQPRVLMLKTETLKGNVETTKGFGFKTHSRVFMVALHTLSSMTESTREAKIKLFKDLGWSEEEVFSAFRKKPLFLATSEKKITQGADFFAKMFNWNASVISTHPLLLMFSLEERIIPRFTVYQILKSNELFSEEKSKLITMFCLSKKAFLQKYVFKYQDEFPDLLKVYKREKVNDLDGGLVKRTVAN